MMALFLLAGAALAQAQTGGAGANPVSYRLESYVVSQVTADDGSQQETFTEATSARPGQVVEYRLFVQNVGDTTLPPGTVVVTGPVPTGTSYVDGSATPTSDQVLTEFTADGQTYGEPPLIVAGTGGGPERRHPHELRRREVDAQAAARAGSRRALRLPRDGSVTYCTPGLSTNAA